MLWVVACLVVAVYGFLYAKNPTPYLQRRLRRTDVPPQAIQTARITGGILTVLGVLGAIWAWVRL